MIAMCEKCGYTVDVLYGADMYCANCGHLTKDADINKVVKRRPVNDGIRDALTGGER